MKEIMLTRQSYLDTGTFGTMRLTDGAIVVTVERPWLNNRPGVSCIPEGVYSCRRGFFHRGGYATFEVCDVPGRSLIKFHKANWPRELQGCIAPNLKLVPDPGSLLRGVSSAQAFARFMASLEGESEFRLRIEGVQSVAPRLVRVGAAVGEPGSEDVD